MRARIAIALFSFIPGILCAHHSRSDYDTSEFVEMEGEPEPVNDIETPLFMI